ncbi:MAG: efflux RND transporter permease subunit [Planctomycetota bacterium]
MASRYDLDANRDGGWSTLFLRNRYLLWLSCLGLVAGGLWAAASLPRLEDPRITNRGPLIITPVPGASAERVDTLVTEVLENALEEIAEIATIDSTSSAGVSVIGVELEDRVTSATNGRLFAEVRDKVAEARAALPPEAGEPIVDDQRDPAAFTLILAVTWDVPGEPGLGMLNRVAEELADRLRGVSGTELVRVYGEPEEEIVVRVEPDELLEVGLSPGELAGRIAAADAKRPGGALRTGSSDVLIEVAGEFETLRRVKDVAVQPGDGGSVLTVGDLGTVSRGWRTPEEEVALYDGRRAVLVGARADSRTRVDRWADAADAALAEFTVNRSPGIGIERMFEQEAYTAERLAVLSQNLLMGAGVILLVVLLLMGLRPAVVVALALPLVVAAVGIGWALTGTQVHQMSIFGLIIALGLMIDNAIVVTDDVAAARAKGMSAIDAVGSTVRHLFVPLSASTITTVLAFAPIMLLEGGPGDFVGSIGLSVALAIVASFGIALTVTASLAGLFIKPRPAGAKRRWWRDGFAPRWLTGGSERALRGLMAAPLIAVGIAVTPPVAGFVIAPTLGRQFFPPIDRNMFEVRVWLRADASVSATTAAARDIEADLRELGGVEHVSWLVGGSHPTAWYNLVMNQDGAANYAQAFVTTDSAETTKALLDRAQIELNRRNPNAQILVRQFAQGPPVVADVEYRLYGPNTAELQRLGDRYRRALQRHPDVIHTQTTMPRGEPKLVFAADESEALIGGVSLADLAEQLETSIDGAVGGSIVEDLERLPVRVRYPEAHRADLDAITSTAFVDAGRGDRWVSAASLGSFQLVPETGGITRNQGRRTNIIKAYTRNGSLPIDISASVLAELEAEGFTLPEGYSFTLGGAQEQDGEANASLARFAPLLALFMASALILAFRSVTYSLLLGGVAVLSVGLALLSTWAIGFPVSFNTILGTLGLIGVALNDSIVVLAAIRANPKAAAGDREAVVRTVMGCTRHVLSTTLTTIGGFLPLLLFVGGDFWPSLAIVLAGGIAGASLIALLFIPGVYLMITRDNTSAVPG